jgi:hypothetical protein
METSKLIKNLSPFLYDLYRCKNTQDIETLFDPRKALEIHFDSKQQKEVLKSLDWVVKHPDYNFQLLGPDSQRDNSDIYQYLKKIHDSLHKS